MRKYLIITLAIIITGCAGQRIVLENDEGKRVTCEVSTASAMLTGTLMRDAKMRKCTSDYEDKGYTKVIEAEQQL